MGRLRPLITQPSDVLAFLEPCPSLITASDENKGAFRLSSVEFMDETGEVMLGKVELPSSEPTLSSQNLEESSNQRIQRLQLSSDYLRCRVVRSRIQFQVGAEALSTLRMIERHFFQGELIRTFDMVLGYCIPESVNTHDLTYELPILAPHMQQELERHPVAIDCFFFDGEQLLHHYRAEHDYRDWLCSSRAAASMPDAQAIITLARGGARLHSSEVGGGPPSEVLRDRPVVRPPPQPKKNNAGRGPRRNNYVEARKGQR